MPKSKGSDYPSIYAKLRQMEGMLKEVYRELGGAERAIREEREGFDRERPRRRAHLRRKK